MDIDDYVFIINKSDRYYGTKFIIRAVEMDFQGCITGYTVNGNGGKWRDYLPTDLHYTTKRRIKFTTQMQLF